MADGKMKQIKKTIQPLDPDKYKMKHPMFGGTHSGAFEKTVVDIPKGAKRIVTHSPTMMEVDMHKIHSHDTPSHTEEMISPPTTKWDTDTGKKPKK